MQRSITLMVGLLVAVFAGNTLAQQYSSRSIRVVIPFPAGGNADTFARVLYQQAESAIGTNFVIDNRGGANGIIGADVVKNANPDGYTLLYTPFAFAINPVLLAKMPFDIIKDFTPVTNVATGLGYLVVVNPKVPVKSVADLITLAKKEQVRYSSAGVGNGQHLAGSLLSNMAQINMLHVPYKGGGPAITACISGEVQLHFPSGTVGVPHHKAGRVRAIAFTGEKRLSSLPDTPTVGETVKGYVSDAGWHGVFGPAGMSPAITKKIQEAIHTTLQNPTVRAKFVDNGYEPNGDPPAVWAKKYRVDVKRFAELAKAAGIEPQ